ncbi:Uma2 family endonuclease [Streptomyces polygonati]|uniref:Uma2 family endonuclease n=1 Tax=Streptomyces polygonati TaxID=1617087 RepID=A0ABV8HP33_9ACTN
MGAPMSTTAGDDGQDPGPVWPTPPPGGWTADDLEHIPGLPPHTELIDGGLFFVSPQTYFHMAVLRLLESALLDQAPPEFDVVREMTTTLGEQDRPEPDLMVVPYTAFTQMRQTSFDPAEVVLAVEIVSKESATRDRRIKPHKYAAAGIQHFWRVEENAGLPVVYVYELDASTGSYAVNGIHHGQLKVPVPFLIDIDLTKLRRRRDPAGAPVQPREDTDPQI